MENRTFLTEWLRILFDNVGRTAFSSDDVARVSEAVAGNYKLSWNQRTLANIAPFFGTGARDDWRIVSLMWHGDGAKQSPLRMRLKMSCLWITA